MFRSFSVRAHLMVLLLVAVIPTSLFAGGVMVLYSHQQERALSSSLQETSRAISLAVDREVESTIKRLELLGTSSMLRTDKLAEFHNEARAVITRAVDWQSLLVFDPSGAPLISTRIPAGSAVPVDDEMRYVRLVVQTQRPAISNLFISPITHEPVVHVAVPIVQRTGVAFVLVASIDLHGFNQILENQAVRSDGIAAIVDTNMKFIARSRDSRRFIGKHLIPALAEDVRERPEGTKRNAVYDGPDVYASWSRSSLTGWTVTFGVPAAPHDEALGRSLLMLAGIGSTVLLASLFVAFLIGRRIAGGLQVAAERASALTGRKRVEALTSPVTELEVLGSALEQSGLMLERDGVERQRAEAERLQLLKQEKQAREDAEAANRAKDEFLAMLGHELRNPLAPILTAVELAKYHGNEVIPHGMQVIERQAKHLAQLVDDLLDVSRIARGKVPLEKRPVELSVIVAKALEIAGPLLESKRHLLVVDVPASGLLVDADERRLAQAISNLLTNAAKFTPAHGHISITASRVGDGIRLEVTDDGMGITPELLPRVFDLFTQGALGIDRSEGGLGLGLALVRSFVELHGGSVAAHSDGPGRGSTFEVRLLAATAAETVDTGEPAVEAASACGRAPRARVLLVDDNEDAATLLAELLTACGHDVRVATDAAGALDVATEFVPELAIVDLGLPDIDGYELARRLAAKISPAPYLIALTGYSQERDRERSRDAGFREHLVKPANLKQVLGALETGTRVQREAAPGPGAN